MRNKLSFLVILMMAMAIPQSVYAYYFSSIAPTGQTLYYNPVGNGVVVTYPASSSNPYGGYTAPSGDLEIPDSVMYEGHTYPVIGIYGLAFSNCGLTSVIIPNTVTSIGSCAFEDCINLTSVVIPNSVTSIGFSAFEDCSSLTSIALSNSVTSIEACVFKNCISLTSVTIPNSVITIGGESFHNCYSLSSITIPNSVTSIGNYAFRYCSGLTSMTIPSSVITIGEEVFDYCWGLTSIEVSSTNTVYDSRNNCNAIIETASNTLIRGCINTTIPNSVTTIDNGAFFGCIGLTSITIPNSVISIGGGAFRDCSSLAMITSLATVPPTLGMNCFYNVNMQIPVYVPCESVTAYLSTSGWSVFPNIQCNSAQTYTITVASNNPTMGSVTGGGTYNSGATTTLTATANSGYHFSHWQDNNTDNPRTITVTSDTTYTAYFEANAPTQYTITVNSANPSMGSVTGGGTYNEGTTATLTATANSGYHFTRWQDNNTQNPRTITVTGNATYTAYFEADGGDDDCPTITLFPWNASFDENLTCWRTLDADGDGYNWMNYQDYAVSESYSYFDGTNQGLTPDNWLISQRIQIPSSGTYTLSWTAAGLNDNYYNEHYSVYVSTTGDNPSDFTTQLFSETLNTPNAVNRNVSLNNYRGQTVRIAFRHHNTNDVFVLGIANVKISQGTQGIDDIDENGLLVYVEGDNIHIDDVAGQSVTVYAIDGRIISAVTNATVCLSIPVAAAGVYIVKVGDHPARKVVVIR